MTPNPTPELSERDRRTHELKCWPEQYDAIVSGAKTFEFRFDDRGFDVGDTLHLRRYDPTNRRYTGESTTREITHILSGKYGAPSFGLPFGYAVLSLAAPQPPSLPATEPTQFDWLPHDDDLRFIRRVLDCAPTATDADVTAAKAMIDKMRTALRPPATEPVPHDAGSHSQQMTPAVQRVIDAADKRRAAMPKGCTTPTGCHDNGCHGACLPPATEQREGAADERAEFERRFCAVSPITYPDDPGSYGGYVASATHHAWMGWQARARSTALAAPSPAVDAGVSELHLAALRWWESRRPIGWDAEQHLANPSVNATCGADTKLMEAAALAAMKEPR